MALIEQNSPRLQGGIFHLPGWGVIGIVSALVTICGFAARGFSENGLRLGSEVAWRFTFLIYFAAVIAGPLARLIPWPTLKRICQERRQLVCGLCAGFGVYLASVLVPNTLPAPGRDGLTAGMTIFASFGALLVLVIAYAAGHPTAHFLGERISKAILRVGMSTFWVAYTAAGLSHISGPHRPDPFYGFSLSLMVFVLLLRFADCFAIKLKGLSQP